MASLTDYTSGASAGKQVIAPAPVYNPLAEVAQTGAGLFQAVAQRDATAARKATQAREDTTFQQAQADKNVINKTVVALASQDQQPTYVTQNQDINNGLTAAGVPADITNSIAQIKKVQTAESQGKMPIGTSMLHSDALIASIIRDNPNSAGALLHYVSKETDIGHYAFASADQALKQQATDQELANTATKTYVDVATTNGLVTPDMSIQQQAQVGQAFAYNQSQIAQNKAQYEAQAAKAAANTAERGNLDWEKKNHSSDQVDLLLDNGTKIVSPVIQRTIELTSAAFASDRDVDKQRVTTEIIPRALAALDVAHAQARSDAVRAGVNVDSELKRLDDFYDTQKALVTSIPQGDFKQKSDWYANTQTKLGLDVQQAAPLYEKISKLPGGTEILNSIVSSDPTALLGKDAITTIQSEIRQLANPKTTTSQRSTIMDDVVQIASGNKNITQLTDPIQARNALNGVIAAMDGGQKAISGDPKNASPDQLNSFSNLYGSTLLATNNGIQPNSQDIGTMYKASTVVFDPKSLSSIESMMNNNDPTIKARGAELMQYRRDSAIKLHDEAMAAGGMQSKDGVWKLSFDKSQNLWVVKADRDNYIRTQSEQSAVVRNSVATGHPLYSLGVSFDQLSKNAPDEYMAQKAKVLNTTTDALVYSDYSDPKIKGTPAERRRYYDLNEPTADMQAQKAKNGGQTASEQFNTQADKLTHDLEVLPGTISTHLPAGRARYIGAVNETADKFGVPHELADFLFTNESSYDPNADTKSSPSLSKYPQALGLGQFQEATGKRYGLMTPEDRKDPAKAIPAALNYLSDLHKKYGNWNDAFAHYGTTAGTPGARAKVELNGLLHKLGLDNETHQQTLAGGASGSGANE